jgi:HlyD family secretion protein
VRSSGTVVAPGTVLVTLVPHGDELQAEVAIRNDDIGFVHAGQAAQVKLAAYPFQKYGLLEGEVVRISADAVDTPPAREARPDVSAAATDNVAAYRARVALRRQSVAFEGFALPLASGMVATAEIRLGERTLAEYLLAPVRKAWHEAARER